MAKTWAEGCQLTASSFTGSAVHHGQHRDAVDAAADGTSRGGRQEPPVPGDAVPREQQVRERNAGAQVHVDGEAGTAIGSAIRVANQAFSSKEKEFKAIILLTDGEDHGSKPLKAAQAAKKSGVRIFTIGIGTFDGSTVPASGKNGFKRDRQGRVVLSKLDEKLLRDIARETGGVYYRSTRGEVEVNHLVGEIGKMSQKGLKSEMAMQYEENFQYFLIPVFLLMIAEMAFGERKK